MSTTQENANKTSRLLRSRSNIAPVLEALAARNENVSIELRDNQGSITTRILLADATGDFIIIAPAADERLNSGLLALARVTMVAQPDNWHIEFVGAAPSAVVHEGAAAIRVDYPEILTVHQRRQYQRHEVAPGVMLHCVADAGGYIPFDAQIRDISMGGICVLVYPPDVLLEPGTLLIGSRIDVPAAEPVTVDLEVRYSELLTLEDGSHVRCSGFRFLNAAAEVRQTLVDAMRQS